MLANSSPRHLPIVNVAISSHKMIQTIDSSTGSMVCTVCYASEECLGGGSVASGTSDLMARAWDGGGDERGCT